MNSHQNSSLYCWHEKAFSKIYPSQGKGTHIHMFSPHNSELDSTGPVRNHSPVTSQILCFPCLVPVTCPQSPWYRAVWVFLTEPAYSVFPLPIQSSLVNSYLQHSLIARNIPQRLHRIILLSVYWEMVCGFGILGSRPSVKPIRGLNSNLLLI